MIADYPQWVQAVSAGWAAVKQFVDAAGIDNDLMHVLAGPAMQITVALLLRRSLQHLAPWLIVLALELLNEWHDLLVETWPVRNMQYGEGLKDILLTMLLPTVILLLTRHYPHWFGMRPPRRRQRSRRNRPGRPDRAR